jgi:hypothetical protein
MNDKSHLTAISRKTLSSPVAFLAYDLGVIPACDEGKNGLDFGCGKGQDASFLAFDKYDPHFFPNLPDKKYDLILCNYVLNVVGESEGQEIINQIKSFLKPTGTAFLTVRRDVKTDGFTKKGTYQRNVILDLPVVRENTKYCIYKLSKTSGNNDVQGLKNKSKKFLSEQFEFANLGA